MTARHFRLTGAISDHTMTQLSRLKLLNPRVHEAEVILDVTPTGQKAEIVLHCARHVTISADTETQNLYEAIDQTVAKIGRQMRKVKTKHLRCRRDRKAAA